MSCPLISRNNKPPGTKSCLDNQVVLTVRHLGIHHMQLHDTGPLLPVPYKPLDVPDLHIILRLVPHDSNLSSQHRFASYFALCEAVSRAAGQRRNDRSRCTSSGRRLEGCPTTGAFGKKDNIYCKGYCKIVRFPYKLKELEITRLSQHPRIRSKISTVARPLDTSTCLYSIDISGKTSPTSSKDKAEFFLSKDTQQVFKVV